MKLRYLFKKQFYFYNYYRIKREKPLDYIFFDAKVFFIFLFVFLVGLFTFFPFDYKFRIPSLENQAYILESLLKIISIFIGISFSFIILSFNIFYKHFGRYAFLDFFKIRSAKICITLLITTIILLTYSVYFFKETVNKITYTDFLFLFSIILTTVSFFSIFPFFIKLLRSSQNREHILQLFKKIGSEEYIVNKFLAHRDKNMASFYHKDPISLISEIGLSSIKDFDNNTLDLICNQIQSFFVDSISKQKIDDEHINLIELYYNFIELLTDFYALSIKEKNEKFAKTIINTRFKLEEYVLKDFDNKIFEGLNDFGNTYRHWEINFDYEKYFKKAVQFDEDEICKLLISNYSSFCGQSIIKLFPKGLKYTQDKHYDVVFQLDTTFEPLRYFSKIVDILLTYKKDYLISKVFGSFNGLEYKVLEIETTNETKCFIYSVIHKYKKDIYEAYLKSTVSDHIGYLDFPFTNGGHIRKKIYCNSIFLGLLEIVDLLFSKEKLNNVVLNLVKAEMLFLIREKDFAGPLIPLTIEKFEKLSKQISKDDTDYKKDIYLKLYKYLKIIKEDLNYNKAPKKLIDKAKKAVNTFQFQEKFKKDFDKSGFISDERLT